MAEIVNLRMARKAKARAEARNQAAANRAKHGQPKVDRTRRKLDAAREAQRLDGARRERDD